MRYCINLAECLNYWIGTPAESYQRMADYEELVMTMADGGQTVTVRNPTSRRITAMVIEQRLPFNSVWHDDEELVHVANGKFGGETKLLLSLCRAQTLCVEGVDPEGAYRVQIDDEPARYHAPRIVRTIQAQLSNSKTRKDDTAITRRTKFLGITTFLDLMIQGDENNFVERTVRIQPLPREEGEKARVAMLMATPKKTGRVTPTMESVPAVR